MTYLSYVQCWQCQIMCRFCCFVVNIQGTRYSLPERHRRPFQNLPYTMDPKYPVPIPHRKVASLLSPPESPPEYPQHVADIRTVHTDQIIVFRIIRPRHLPGPLPLTGDSMPCKLRLRRRIHRIPDAVPDFLCTGGRGGNLEAGGELGVGY